MDKLKVKVNKASKRSNINGNFIAQLHPEIISELGLDNYVNLSKIK